MPFVEGVVFSAKSMSLFQVADAVRAELGAVFFAPSRRCSSILFPTRFPLSITGWGQGPHSSTCTLRTRPICKMVGGFRFLFGRFLFLLWPCAGQGVCLSDV